MSTWTHVVGCIRIDGTPSLGDSIEEVKKIIGPICLYDNWKEESTLPRGSEGSLQYGIIEYEKGLPWIAIPIWGDLRNFWDENFIKEWWKNLLTKFDENSYWIRDAVLKIQVEEKPCILLTEED